ncbi:MAG: FixJ family two-component response regulator [Pirellulaceae bacterium]|jgi:FixJ family two-component response regulator
MIISKSNDMDNSQIVLVVDDDPDIRRFVAKLMHSVSIRVETFPSGSEFLKNYDAEWSGCLVLDVRMPGMTGLQLQSELSSQEIEIPIIFMSADDEISTVAGAMRAGALDFIPKPLRSQNLLERINEALSSDHHRRLCAADKRKVDELVALLTAREREVLSLLNLGEGTKFIASSLEISSKTVDNHRAKVFEKLGVENAAQLVRLINGLSA